MIIRSKVKNYDRDLIQITEITVHFEENSDYQFNKYQIIFCFLVILIIICNIVLICLLRN